jgi:methylglyoxal synthase
LFSKFTNNFSNCNNDIKSILIEISIIAHDSKKAEIIDFVYAHKELSHHKNIKLVATGMTGLKAEQVVFQVLRLLCCPLGGDA